MFKLIRRRETRQKQSPQDVRHQENRRERREARRTLRDETKRQG